MEKKGKTIVIEGTAKPGDVVLEPHEVMQLVMRGAESLLEEYPDMSDEKRALVNKVIQEERVQKAEQLKVVMRRYKVALNHAKVFQARNRDKDYTVELNRKEPTIDEEGYIELCASDMLFKDEKMMKAFAAASRIAIQTKEVEVDDGFEYWPQLVMRFRV